MKVRAVCINDKDRPKEIPVEKWIKEGEVYHIKHVYNMAKQGMILGVSLWEINLKGCDPYNAFRMSRFAIDINDLEKLMELMKACSDLSDFTDDKLKELIKDTELVEKLF